MGREARHAATSRSGSARATGPGTFRGDHDLWRLPQADDRDTGTRTASSPTGPSSRRAAGTPDQPQPGRPGRRRRSPWPHSQTPARDPARARLELRQARLLYSRAATAHPPHPLVTALPHAFYPESTWRDDMQLGAAEIALAAHRLGEPATPLPARQRAHWARALPRRARRPTPSTSTTRRRSPTPRSRDAMDRVAHGRLAVTRARPGRGPPAPDPARGRATPATTRSRAGVAVDRVRRQLAHLRADRHRRALRPAHRTAAGSAASPAASAPGCSAGTPGASAPWSASAPRSRAACSTRSPTSRAHRRRAALDVGAVVNGPNGTGNFEGGLGGFQDGMLHCSAAPSTPAPFDGHGQPVRRRRPRLADRRARAGHDRCRDHRSRGRPAPPRARRLQCPSGRHEARHPAAAARHQRPGRARPPAGARAPLAHAGWAS